MANGKRVIQSQIEDYAEVIPSHHTFFPLASNVLSILINTAVTKKSLVGARSRKRCVVASHLLFADDSLVFLEANSTCCSTFVVQCFSEASGLSINIQKSSQYFSASTQSSSREEIKNIFGMEEMDEGAKHLGLPMPWGRSKKESTAYIKIRS